MSSPTMAEPPTHARLAGNEVIAFVHTADELTFASGALLTERDLVNRFYVLLDGEIAVTRGADGSEEILSTGPSAPGEQLPVLLGTLPTVTGVRVLRSSRFLRADMDVYLEHVAGWSPYYTIVVGSLIRRVHDTIALLRQQEKLAALGKLSAGLAHELNNPAAAAQRAADHLRECIDILATNGVQHMPGATGQRAVLIEIEREALERLPARPQLDPLSLADHEDEMASWLDGRDVPDSWRIASSLAEAGVDVAWLESIAAQMPPDDLGPMLARIGARLRAARLLAELDQTTDRIAELVGALKNYTYRDQAPVQEVDIHQGLENTLVILKHRLKEGVVIHREFDHALPDVTAFGSELNQVWSILIDNALDALDGRGQVRLRTAQQGGQVVVEVTDDGPGIPGDIQPHIFAPFISTKAQGQGAGIGLHTAYNIIVNRHQGKLSFTSEPGATTFQVTLPVRPTQA